MATVSRQARAKKQRLIVLRKNEPIFELRPLSENEVIFAHFDRDIEEAEKDIATGRVHTQEQVEKMFGL